jgi:hypothetical protein
MDWTCGLMESWTQKSQIINNSWVN